jgi:quercetin dioxygenase-like cupin family protein
MRSRLAAVLAVAFASGAFAQTPPAPVRTILQQAPVSGAPNEQLVIASVAFAPGARLAYHIHPGEEAGVVQSGVLVIEMEGRAPLVLKAGDSYVVPRGVRHQASAPDGEAHVIATFVIDKDQPLATAKP